MSEFASLAMVRALERGLYVLGLAPICMQSDLGAVPPGGATVDIDAKRALLMHAIREGGVQCLVQLGRGVHHFADEPTHRAMTSATTPLELLQRWQRLEKYIHSLHRVELLESAENHLCVAHPVQARRHGACAHGEPGRGGRARGFARSHGRDRGDGSQRRNTCVPTASWAGCRCFGAAKCDFRLDVSVDGR